ncbi:MAG: hypothetical protein ACXW2I_07420 [Burkholderiales bacterium]
MTSDFQWTLRGRCYKLGHDVQHVGGVIPAWVVTGRYFEPKDIVPHLFADTDPGFHERCKAGDIIVTGRNFGMGPKMNGYIGMAALGLGLVCESIPFLAYRAAIGHGLRVMTNCANVTEFCESGDDLEVDFRDGFFINHTRDIRREYPPIPDALQEIVALGGNAGWLKQWGARKREANTA